MIAKVKRLFDKNEILNGNYGIEREGLRVDIEGKLSNTNHLKCFGNKSENPYITTDFSESQIELITPVFNDIEQVYKFNNALYDIVANELENEYIWPQSMPCILPDDNKIPIAKYEGKEAEKYREKLLKKYGAKKQLISGIHFNFSFSEDTLRKIFLSSNTELSYKDFKNNLYLKIARNYLRYRWIVVYLLGSTSIMHKSYVKECVKCLKEVAAETYSNEGAVSYRNGRCGYKNKIDLYLDYSSLDSYIKSVKGFINKGIIDSNKEIYSQVRLKAKDNNDFFNSLLSDGIEYLEYRTIDINPFEKGGISLEDMKFIQLFNIYLLIKHEAEYDKWQEEANYNQDIIALKGQNKNLILKRNGKDIEKEEWALEILREMQEINNELNLIDNNILDNAIEKVKRPKLTYAYKISEIVNKKGYVNTYLDFAKKYKKEAYNSRFKLEGYEDLELSTQILMKEAIKRGLTIEVVDRSENFISISNREKTEYIKQATKTSLDSYITVLIMENKLVTKKVLSQNNIVVPKGDEYTSFKSTINNIWKYVNKPIVIKPKSTNYGLGISVFKNGANEEDIKKALTIAFNNDNTVLVEEFISGKEFRFLVIDEKVVGVLHRVPANVVGDGERTIKELVDIKNENPLRGVGYRTPLEKIKLEENVELFLKQKNRNFNYVPKKDQVVYLRENSNISTGGDSIDYTDVMPDRFKEIAINAAKAVGAKICGVDMMINCYNDKNSNYAIIELNFNPAIHIHSYPYKGKERNIAINILKLLKLI